jgi:hypothetical protein
MTMPEPAAAAGLNQAFETTVKELVERTAAHIGPPAAPPAAP